MFRILQNGLIECDTIKEVFELLQEKTIDNYEMKNIITRKVKIIKRKPVSFYSMHPELKKLILEKIKKEAEDEN